MVDRVGKRGNSTGIVANTYQPTKGRSAAVVKDSAIDGAEYATSIKGPNQPLTGSLSYLHGNLCSIAAVP